MAPPRTDVGHGPIGGALRTWVGAGVRRRRRDQGWTQRELARRASVNVVLVNRLERGENVSLETLGRIVDALDWDASADLVQAPPAIVAVRMLAIRRLRVISGQFGRLLLNLEQEAEEDDHAAA